MNKKVNTKAITITGVFCALAYLLTFVFRFKVSFLTFDFKDAVIALPSLIYGAPYGIVCSGIVALIEFVTVSDTGLYGLIMNFLSSGTFALVCGLVYKYKRTLSGAILGLISSCVSVTAVMLLANIFITPFYMGVPRSAVIDLLPTLILPFNAAKTVINSAFTLLMYKPITNALKHYGIIDKTNYNKMGSTRYAVIFAVSLVIIVLVVLFLIFKLGGVFEIV